MARSNSYKISDIVNNKQILDIKVIPSILKSGKNKGYKTNRYTYVVKCLRCGKINEYTSHAGLKLSSKEYCKYCSEDKYKNKIIGPYKFLCKVNKKSRNDILWKCVCINCGDVSYKVPSDIKYQLRKKALIGKYCHKCSPTHANVLTKEVRKKVAISSKETVAKQYIGQVNHYNHKGMPRNIVLVSNTNTTTQWICGKWRYKHKTYSKCSTNIWECIAFVISKKMELGVWDTNDAITYLNVAKEIVDTHPELDNRYNANQCQFISQLLKRKELGANKDLEDRLRA